MGFFDLSIPYLESSKSSESQNQTLKQNRLKLVIRTMELGYSGVAFNRTIKGVISDADRCSIPLFTVSSLIKLLPALAASAKLHRDLLGVPSSAPFRQYTRLTVCVDSAPQAIVLNSTNPVLKSYNIVAARPLNQNAFDQACQFSEVDIITIDFTEKLPFRLKQPIVKAAIQRGVYFEITYSGLIRDVQTRCQVISNAKMLVDWTYGKNIILTSATSSANELRGPYDIANLASLLGMSKERAKDSVSKNCRNLISKALRKRQYHNEAIRVEALTTSEQSKFLKPSSGDWLKWDPISSGQGDLLLDDIEKCFLASGDYSKVKAIDFTSIMNDRPSNDLQLKNMFSGVASLSESQYLVAKASDKITGAIGVNKVLPRVEDAAMADAFAIESPKQVCELSFKDATNVELVLTQSKDTEVTDDDVTNSAMTSPSVLESNVKESQSGSVSLVSHQPSPVTDVDAKDVMMTDTSAVADPITEHEKIDPSALVQTDGCERRTIHEAITEEAITSNVSEAHCFFSEVTQSDLQRQNCDLSNKLSGMETEEGLESPKPFKEDAYKTDMSVPSLDLLHSRDSKIESPENVDLAMNMQCLASDRAHKAASPTCNEISEDQVNSAAHNHVMNGRIHLEQCIVVEQEDTGNINLTALDEQGTGKQRARKRSRRAGVFPLKHLLHHTRFKKKQPKLKGKRS